MESRKRTEGRWRDPSGKDAHQASPLPPSLQDPNFYPPTSWKSESWVSQKTEILTSKIKEIQTRFPTWTPDQYLRGMCSIVGQLFLSLELRDTSVSLNKNQILQATAAWCGQPGKGIWASCWVFSSWVRINLSHEFQVDSVPTVRVLALSEATRIWTVTSAMMSLHEPNTSRTTASSTSDATQVHYPYTRLTYSTHLASGWRLQPRIWVGSESCQNIMNHNKRKVIICTIHRLCLFKTFPQMLALIWIVS